MGSQHPSPNVKTLCNFQPWIWTKIMTWRDAESTCFKGSRTSCDVIILGIFCQILAGKDHITWWMLPAEINRQVTDLAGSKGQFLPRGIYMSRRALCQLKVPPLAVDLDLEVLTQPWGLLGSTATHPGSEARCLVRSSQVDTQYDRAKVPPYKGSDLMSPLES